MPDEMPEANSLSSQKRKHILRGGKMSDFTPEPVSGLPKCPKCGELMAPTGGPHTVPTHRCFGCDPLPAAKPESSRQFTVSYEFLHQIWRAVGSVPQGVNHLCAGVYELNRDAYTALENLFNNSITGSKESVPATSPGESGANSEYLSPPADIKAWVNQLVDNSMKAGEFESSPVPATGGATPTLQEFVAIVKAYRANRGWQEGADLDAAIVKIESATPEPKLEEVARKIACAIRQWRDGQAYVDEHSTLDSVIADTLRPYFEAKGSELDKVRGERDEAHKAIAWANNSLYGSHGFFLSTDGGEANEHHLDSQIEVIKGHARRASSLEAALRKYGDHYGGCDSLKEYGKPKPCDCGFQAALLSPASEVHSNPK